MEDKKITCIIVDDEPLARQVIREFAEKHADLKIIAEFGDPQEACKNINRDKPDLIFLDIQMPEINGFELIGKLDHLPVIIFCTAFDEYAIQAFENNAIDYLLKPFDQERFDKALQKAKKYLNSETIPHNLNHLIKYLEQEQSAGSRLLVKDGQQLLIIEPDEILWVEAQHDYCMLHTSRGQFLITKTMQHLENRLRKFSFFRIHRSMLVNFSFVQEVKPWSSGRYLLVLENGEQIESSKSGAKMIKEMIL